MLVRMAFPPLEQLIRDAFGREAAAALGSPQGFSLHGSIGMEAFLRGDGSVWVETWEFDQTDRAERREVLGAERLTNLVIAAQRRPALAALLPQRNDDSRKCERCDGGSLPHSAETQRPGAYLVGGSPVRVYCFNCGGLGFV